MYRTTQAILCSHAVTVMHSVCSRDTTRLMVIEAKLMPTLGNQFTVFKFTLCAYYESKISFTHIINASTK